jgi:hypothetical protein
VKNFQFTKGRTSGIRGKEILGPQLGAKIMRTEWIQLDSKNPLRMRKETLPVGEWSKIDAATGKGYKFAITPEIVDHLVLSVKEMRNAGITIPYARVHEGWDLPENRWGEIHDAHKIKAKRKDANGQEIEVDALALDIEFKDEETKKLGIAADVSAGIPPRFIDGSGKEWINPLRHVAATSAPVIHGLGAWQEIAASFTASEFETGGIQLAPFGGGGTPQTVPTVGAFPAAPPQVSLFDKILQLLGLQPQPGVPDQAKLQQIMQALQAALRPGAGAPQPGMPQVAPTGVRASFDNQNGDNQNGAAMGDNQQKIEISPMLIELTRQNYELQLAQLCQGDSPKIDHATKTRLMLQFASPEAIKLELANGGTGQMFKALVEALKENKPVAKSGRTELAPGQTWDSETEIILDHNGQEQTNILQKDADARTKRYKEQGVAVVTDM